MRSDKQYRTPDGSIWERQPASSGLDFYRISGLGHEDDYRAQTLDEVLTSWGTLSLHDPIKAQAEILHKAMSEAEVSSNVYTDAGERLAKWLDRHGYELKDNVE